MNAYADTSFLASLYLRDVNLPKARAFLAAHRSALQYTTLQRHELKNAIRLAVFRRMVTASAATGALAEIADDIASDNLFETGLIWPEVLHLAEELGARHTAAFGTRSLDLLHVAAAASLDATAFLTFDGRRSALAKACGMRVLP